MTVEGSFRVEDFIQAITTQLDRVQDALRLKAVNRPLTYALKDLAMDLKVFVELDQNGEVRFRTSAPNEEGASVVKLAFTTITKPMIEENTVSLEATKSPTLEEIGLDAEERKRLEQVGVRNAAQLRNLDASTGTVAVSRLALVPADRLKKALGRAAPRIESVRPRRRKRRATRPRPQSPQSKPAIPRLNLRPRAQELELLGRNLMADAVSPSVLLDGQALTVLSADDDRLVVELPEDAAGGVLEVVTADGETQTFDLETDETPEPEANGDFDQAWAPVDSTAGGRP